MDSNEQREGEAGKIWVLTLGADAGQTHSNKARGLEKRTASERKHGAMLRRLNATRSGGNELAMVGEQGQW